MSRLTMNAVLAVVHVADAQLRPQVERRLAALERFYAPLAKSVSPARRWHEQLRTLVAVIPLGRAELDPALELVSWGAALPPAIRDAEHLLHASAAQLQELPTPLTAFAARGSQAVLVTATGPTALYAAEGEGVQAWSSHAAASAWLATGQAEVDPAAVTELVANEFVGDERTVLRGVRAVPPATRVALSADGASERTVWPARDRWATVPAADAPALAEKQLLDALDQRLADAPAPVLGMTAGLDSATVAVALRELGIEVGGFTFGGETSDAVGARRTASALGMPHVTGDFQWWADEEGLRRVHEEVRWSEAGSPIGFGDVPWPAPLSHWIVGMGAETGRSFYYAWAGAAKPDPSARHAAAVLIARTVSSLVGADREVVRAHRQRCRRWVDEALAMGAPGWRSLDVVYGEQRVRRWGRGITPRVDAELVPAFASQGLQAVLCSMSLNDRLHDGWQRRFIAGRVPVLERPPPARPQGGLIPPWRRGLALQRLRAMRRAARLPRPAISRGAPWYQQPPWDERPSLGEWLADDVLRSPLLERAFGPGWVTATREAFHRGDAGAGRAALWAGSAVAFDAALDLLR